MPSFHEHTVNIALAAALQKMRRAWNVNGERVGVIAESSERPDIIVRQQGKPTIVIENEFDPASGVEREAIDRLGKRLDSSGEEIRNVIALISPARLKTARDNEALAAQIDAVEYQYALFVFAGDNPPDRFPRHGFLAGNLADLAGFVYRAAISEEAVSGAVIALETAVKAAEYRLKEADADNPDIASRIRETLKQEYNEQTRRMAATILLNALIFQEHLSGGGEIRSLAQVAQECGGGIRQRDILREWRKILTRDHWPIFGVAEKILLALPVAVAQRVLRAMERHASGLASDQISRSHDLFGKVFQRLISDRKFLATFYTRPTAATLLANLAIPEDTPFDGGDWKRNAVDYTVADFACGTGTLLSAAYQRIAELHEKSGGDIETTHPKMIEKALIGCDVVPSSVHLAATMLAGMCPKIPFENTRLHTMLYGNPQRFEYRIGSLELWSHQEFIPVLPMARRQTGRGETESGQVHIRWHSAKLVIMNPPFTRPTNHEGAHRQIPNPAFAAFGADSDLQKELATRHKNMRPQTSCGNGNAGLASDFVDLANRFVAMDGSIALVLPLTFLFGESWGKAREAMARKYRDIVVVSLSSPGLYNYAFSADTGMGEILLVGRRRKDGRSRAKARGNFVVLRNRPDTEIEAAEIARLIRRALSGNVRKLENAPVGGTAVFAGESQIGEIISAELPESLKEPWPIARIKDLSLAQTAHALVDGRLWLPQQGTPIDDFPISPLGKFAKRGPISRDISGTNPDGTPRGPFDVLPLSTPAPTFPCLWAHSAKRETKMLIAPDCECRARIKMDKRAFEVWKTASRAHHSVDFSFGSQPLAVATTERPAIGGRAWPSVLLRSKTQEAAFALWGNSTLGLFCHWWWANKSQEGRGSISPERMLDMPTLDLTRLSRARLAAAKRAFDSLKTETLLPFYRADEDETRKAIDRELIFNTLADWIENPEEIMACLDLLRRKLCAEPSVRGAKE